MLNILEYTDGIQNVWWKSFPRGMCIWREHSRSIRRYHRRTHHFPGNLNPSLTFSEDLLNPKVVISSGEQCYQEKYVWILPQNGSSDVAIGARILAKFDSRVKVKDDDLKEYWVSEKEILGPMHVTSIFGVEDMTLLGELRERSILRNLLIRYSKDLIYTYIGSILVAVNPYKPLPIFDRKTMAAYRKKKLGELPPHIFAVADHSYENMRKMSEKRCIVISGESGAGKTESTKLFLRYFAAISQKYSGKEQQILDSNPILEAFGNAKTVRNDNSSRFGKYISIIFNNDGSIHSAQIKQYLLEKSRIVYQNSGEQNYHIFYALLSGLSASQKERLKLKSVSSYNYLNRANERIPSSSETIQTYKIDIIASAMKSLNFSDTEIWRIFEVIAAILHLGNIEFQTVSASNIEEVSSVTEEEIQHVGTLLQVPAINIKDSLTKKTLSTHGDNVVKFLSKQEAINSRDAFAKKIFGNLFNYIVERINLVLWNDGKSSNCYIGILDIFGFEAFDQNSFEQLCINYANERLQQFFIGHVFKTEQEQYAAEGINWKFVEYLDNREILDLIENGPQSILSIINDSTRIPRGSDESMLDKIIEFNSENPNFLKPKYKHTPVFGIQHYAGIVLYDIKDFVEKNYDSCSLDMKHVIQSSENDFLKKVFASDFETETNSYYKKRMETLSSKFKHSLDLLMSELNECQPFFVRCIKPNQLKKPQKFDRMLCWKQLNYSGMTEVTKIREAGYPVRYDFFQFVEHYRYLVPGIPLAHKTPCKEATERICRKIFRGFPHANFQLGRTKIFLKQNEELFLEREREKILYSYAVVIQKFVRGWLARRRLYRLKKAVILAEKCWTRNRAEIRGNKIRNSLYRLQAKIKSRSLTSQFQRFRGLISRFQAHCRGYLIRSSLKTKFKTFKNNQIETAEKSYDTADFKEFATKYFQDKQNHKFSKKALKNSLIHLIQPEERLAAKAIWLTILRYTGNLSDPQSSSSSDFVGAQMRQILRAIGKGNNQSNQDLDTTGGIGKTNRLYEDWLKARSTDLQKLCFIIAHGIKRTTLRDEIYCQICKILTKNPSEKATRNGWDLLCSCTGCFPPSDLFLNYLKAFIRGGPTKYVSFCLFRLHRTIQNGCRTQPPFYKELHAIKRQKPVSLEVLLTNGATTSVKIDSATTAKELLDMVAKNVKLTDTFGFSLVLAQEVKHFPLGDGSTFVLDALSEYEQYTTELGGSPENIELKFYLKREMFAPWYEFIEDDVSNNLTYYQIKAGVLSGIYECDGTNFPSLIAQICYVEDVLQPSELSECIDNFVASFKDYLPADPIFKEQVRAAYLRMFGKSERSPHSVRSDLIKYAEANWTTEFSKFFHVFGSIRNLKSGQPHPEVPLLMGVNSKGIFIAAENNEKRALAKMDFMEISEVSRKEVTEGQGYILKILTYEGIQISLTFQSVHDNDFHKLLIKIIETLKNYSKFVIAIKNYKTPDKSFLQLEKGDLIALSDDFRGKYLLRNSWAEGLNKRTGETGNFLLDCVEIISTIEEPPETVLKAIQDVVVNGKRAQFSYLTEQLKYYTLESYAAKHFRRELKGKEINNQSELWKYSREKIWQPLHSKLINKDKEAKLAVEVFDAILEYTENNQLLVNEEQLVLKIFSPGIENRELRDETYCQILKQLTSNLKKNCEIKAWELMWMITGLFSCEEELANEVKKFVQSRRTIQIARECLTRFYRVTDLESRKHPPHAIEIEAVKYRPCHLFHRVYFPDGTHKFFQIDSLTKFKELKEDVLNRLKIDLSKTGFCLLLQILGRLFLLPDDYYILDYLQILKKWTVKNKIPKAEGEYKICIMKYTWIDSVPGRNKVTDLKFLFPQEYNYYIQGHYEIPQEDLVQLAGLLYKINSFDETTQPFQKIIQNLVPPKATNLMKTEIWQKQIQENSKKYNLPSKEDCKVMFLKQLKRYSRTVPYFTTIPQTSNLPNYIFYPITTSSRSIV